MSINFPSTRKEVDNRAKADVKSQLTTSNPWLKNSFLSALITGYSGRIYEFYLQLKNALLEMFPDTATGSYIDRWGSYVAITRKAASQATGSLVFTGTVGSIIPGGTTVTSSDGLSYTLETGVTIATNTSSISSLTRSGAVATANTSSEHNLATGMTVTISGADQSEYNGDVVVTVVDADTFTFTVDSGATTPATGTITSSVDSISGTVTSVKYGATTNQVSGSQLTLTSPISGVDSTAYVPYDEIDGAADDEDDESYRARVLYRYQNPVTLFNVAAITSKVLETPGVTRVWVSEAGTETNPISVSSMTRSGNALTVTTAVNHNLEDGQYVTISGADQSDYDGKFKVCVVNDDKFVIATQSSQATTATGTITASPGIPNGQVKVYFTRDNDTSPIPTGTEVNTVKTNLLTIKPAHVSDGDVLVNAPVAVTVDFTFTALTPNTTAMQTAITNSLTALFSEETDVSVPLQQAAYMASIWQTVDETGALVKSFTLSTPTATVDVTEGQLATLGTITFPS